MKVLHLINNLTSGGAEKLLLEMLPFFLKEGIEVDILLLNPEKSVYCKKDLPDGVNLYINSMKYSIYNPLHIFLLKRFFLSYDLIHVHLFPSQYWAALLKLLVKGKIKLITTEHSTLNIRMKYSFLKPLERFIYARYDKIISISPETQIQLCRWVNLKNDRFAVIENGINLEKYKSTQGYERQYIDSSLKEGDIILIMVARLASAKDHITLFKAMLLLPENYKLLIVGEGEKEMEYKTFCKASFLDNRIIFTGFRTDAIQLIKSADICILSSHWEGFGLAAVEAMACGVPVIASKTPGLREVVKGAGMLFEKGNEKELAEAIELIAKSPDLKKQIIEAQCERAKKYDIKRTAKLHASLYRSLFGNP